MQQLKGYVDTHYLKTLATLIGPLKQRSYELIKAQPGHKLLDVGCGPGIDTVKLGQTVGHTGQVFGVDHDAVMIAEADERAMQAGVEAFVRHQRGDAYSLKFDSDWFDGCRSERLFMHLLRPHQALEEMIRVTKSGGRIVIIDPDWGTASMDTEAVKFERQLARLRAERALNNGFSGRLLYRLFKQHHLANISLDIFPLHTTDLILWRYLTRQDEVEEQALREEVCSYQQLESWRASLEQANATGCFFASVNMVLVAGNKP